MAVKRKDLVTIKFKGRKYVVIHGSVTVKLIKRAGKPQFFVLTDGKAGELTRYRDFWEALKAYDDAREARGLATDQNEADLAALTALDEDEKAQLTARLEAQANA